MNQCESTFSSSWSVTWFEVSAKDTNKETESRSKNPRTSIKYGLISVARVWKLYLFWWQVATPNAPTSYLQSSLNVFPVTLWSPPLGSHRLTTDAHWMEKLRVCDVIPSPRALSQCPPAASSVQEWPEQGGCHSAGWPPAHGEKTENSWSSVLGEINKRK